MAELWGRCSLADPRAGGVRRGWNWCCPGDSSSAFTNSWNPPLKEGTGTDFQILHPLEYQFDLSWKWNISNSVLHLHRSGSSLPGLMTGMQHLLSFASFLGFFINAENFAKTSFPAEFDSGCFGASLGYLRSSEKQKEVT